MGVRRVGRLTRPDGVNERSLGLKTPISPPTVATQIFPLLPLNITATLSGGKTTACSLDESCPTVFSHGPVTYTIPFSPPAQMLPLESSRRAASDISRTPPREPLPPLSKVISRVRGSMR